MFEITNKLKDMGECIEISKKNWDNCKKYIPKSDREKVWSILCDYTYYINWSNKSRTQGFDAKMELSEYLESIDITNYRIC